MVFETLVFVFFSFSAVISDRRASGSYRLLYPPCNTRQKATSLSVLGATSSARGPCCFPGRLVSTPTASKQPSDDREGYFLAGEGWRGGAGGVVSSLLSRLLCHCVIIIIIVVGVIWYGKDSRARVSSICRSRPPPRSVPPEKRWWAGGGRARVGIVVVVRRRSSRRLLRPTTTTTLYNNI